MSDPKEGASTLTWMTIGTLISAIFISAFLLISVKVSRGQFDRITAAAQVELTAVMAQEQKVSGRIAENQYQLPVEYAIKKLIEEGRIDKNTASVTELPSPENKYFSGKVATESASSTRERTGATFFHNKCASCHGLMGQGSDQTMLLDQNPQGDYPYKNGPKSFAKVKPLGQYSLAIASLSGFQSLLHTQASGKVFHGYPDLNELEVQSLYEYVKRLAH